MSGTEAVMCATRLARQHRPRSRLLVIFGSYGGGGASYHGWWDGVMAEGGNSRGCTDCLVLKDMCATSLSVLELRASEVAAVLVNPCNAFKPPREQLLVAKREVVGVDDLDYAKWLHKLRELCSRTGMIFVMDEVPVLTHVFAQTRNVACPGLHWFQAWSTRGSGPLRCARRHRVLRQVCRWRIACRCVLWAGPIHEQAKLSNCALGEVTVVGAGWIHITLSEESSWLAHLWLILLYLVIGDVGWHRLSFLSPLA